METAIAAGATYVFPANVLADHVELDNRHNVSGSVTYQIGAQPAVKVPIQPNQQYQINQIGSQALSVANGLPNTLYVIS